MIETKSFQIDLKTLNDAGEFSGYLSVFGVVDQSNDVVQSGAFSRTIKSLESAGRRLPILLNHETDQICGVWTLLREDTKGLYVEGKLAIDTEIGARVRSLMKLGALTGLSIGYIVIKKVQDKQVRRLTEIRLVEGSVVVFPCNLEAQVTDVKAEELEAPDSGVKADEDMQMDEQQKADAAAEEAKAKKEPGHYAGALQDVSDYSDEYHERSKRNEALSNALWKIRRGDSNADEKKKAMRQVRHDHADSMADMDDAQMDKEAAAKKDDPTEVEQKADEAGAKKKKSTVKFMHHMSMAHEFNRLSHKHMKSAMEMCKDNDGEMLAGAPAPDGEDGGEMSDKTPINAKCDDGTYSFNGAVLEVKGGIIVSFTAAPAETSEQIETKEQKQETTEDSDLLHSLRDGFKSLSFDEQDSEPEFKSAFDSVRTGLASVFED